MKTKKVKKLKLKKNIKIAMLIIVATILYLTSGKLAAFNTNLALSTWLLLGADLLYIIIIEN